MTAIDFSNQNRFVAFPMTDDLVYLSVTRNGWITNAGIVIGPKTAWERGDDASLVSLTESGGALEIVLSAGSTTFTFTFNPTDPPNTTRYVAADQGAAYGHAFLTIGVLDSLVFVGGFSFSPNVLLDPIVVQNLNTHFLSSISVANHFSALYVDPDCNVNTSLNGDDYRVVIADLTGDVVFRPGRHVGITITSSTVDFNVTDAGALSVNAPCQALRPLPDDYSTSDEPKCKDLLFTINGIGVEQGQQVFRLEGTAGVVIESVDDNTLKVTFAPGQIFGPAVDPIDCPGGIPPDPYNPNTDTCSY